MITEQDKQNAAQECEDALKALNEALAKCFNCGLFSRVDVKEYSQADRYNNLSTIHLHLWQETDYLRR